jgi:hypothetical protein
MPINKRKENVLCFKKVAIMFILLGVFFNCSGCETAKAVGGIAPAVVKDIKSGFKSTCESLKKADDWFRENLW